MAFRSEKELELASVTFLEKEYSNYKWQVPIYNRVVDLAAIDKNGNLVGIEYKLSNWKRALQQANAHRNTFDYMYVCVPGGNYVDDLKSSAQEMGIGVMIYDESNETIAVDLNAEKQTLHWKPNMDYVKKILIDRGENANC